MPRLVYQPDMYQRLIDMKPSSSNCLEFCLGSIAEMTEGDVHNATDQYSKQNKIGYVHFRNVVGKVSFYKEVFIDEGDIDMVKVLRILKKNNFEGVLIPDHTPQMSSDGDGMQGNGLCYGVYESSYYVNKKLMIIN